MTGRIDLHGLHVAEALECLEELLPSLRTPSRNRYAPNYRGYSYPTALSSHKLLNLILSLSIYLRCHLPTLSSEM